MNKKSKLLIASILSMGLCTSIVLVLNGNAIGLTFASKSKPASLSCSYYFDEENGYRSLYDLSQTRIAVESDLTDVTTWGTVTCNYYNGSQCVCTYTDDYYATFKEFNNFGGFLSRFKAEREVTGYVRGNPTTITY